MALHIIVRGLTIVQSNIKLFAHSFISSLQFTEIISHKGSNGLLQVYRLGYVLNAK